MPGAHEQTGAYGIHNQTHPGWAASTSSEGIYIDSKTLETHSKHLRNEGTAAAPEHGLWEPIGSVEVIGARKRPSRSPPGPLRTAGPKQSSSRHPAKKPRAIRENKMIPMEYDRGFGDSIRLSNSITSLRQNGFLSS